MSEYLIVLLLAVSLLLLYCHRQLFVANVFRQLVASIVITIFSELAFTFYISVMRVKLARKSLFRKTLMRASGRHIHPDDRERFFLSVQEAIEQVADWEFEGRLVTDAKGEQWFKGVSRPIKGENELVFNGVMIDLDEQKKTQKELLESRRQIETQLAEQQKLHAILEKAKERELSSAC